MEWKSRLDDICTISLFYPKERPNSSLLPSPFALLHSFPPFLLQDRTYPFLILTILYFSHLPSSSFYSWPFFTSCPLLSFPHLTLILTIAPIKLSNPSPNPQFYSHGSSPFLFHLGLSLFAKINKIPSYIFAKIQSKFRDLTLFSQGCP